LDELHSVLFDAVAVVLHRVVAKVPGWLITYRDKCPVPGIEPGHGQSVIHPSTNRTRRDARNAIITKPNDHSCATCLFLIAAGA